RFFRQPLSVIAAEAFFHAGAQLSHTGADLAADLFGEPTEIDGCADCGLRPTRFKVLFPFGRANFLQDNTPAGVGDEYRLAVAHLPAEPLFAARLVALL